MDRNVANELTDEVRARAIALAQDVLDRLRRGDDLDMDIRPNDDPQELVNVARQCADYNDVFGVVVCLAAADVVS